jgi:hypothetical protein
MTKVVGLDSTTTEPLCGHNGFRDDFRCDKPAGHVGNHRIETKEYALFWDSHGGPISGGPKGVVLQRPGGSDKW